MSGMDNSGFERQQLWLIPPTAFRSVTEAVQISEHRVLWANPAFLGTAFPSVRKIR